MGLSHQDVVRKFSEGVTNKRGSRVFSEGDALYSYGYHFTLAQRRRGEDNLVDGQPWYLLNGDKFSASTSGHQSYTFQYFRQYPRVSFSAIDSARLDHRTAVLVDFVRDTQEVVSAGDEGFETFERRVPDGATLSVRSDRDGNPLYKSWHRIGGAVLRCPRRELDFLCAMDEGSYFVSQLPRKVRKVSEAFEALKPARVKAALRAGVEVVRQGEWFCVRQEGMPMGLRLKDFRAAFELPRTNQRSNIHLATRGVRVRQRFYIMGRLRHVRPGGWWSEGRGRTGTGEHRTVKFDKGVVYEAIRNTSRGDWSSSAAGGVD
jgi:hypothetical protein